MNIISRAAIGATLLCIPVATMAQENAVTPMAAAPQDAPVAALPVTTAPVAEVAKPAPTSKIVMYRPSAIMGYALGCPIRYKGQEVVELGRGKYAEWAVPAGHYILTNKTASVDIHVDAGETAYVRCQIKPGMLTGRADLQIVDKESFEQHQADYAKKDVELDAGSM